MQNENSTVYLILNLENFDSVENHFVLFNLN